MDIKEIRHFFIGIWCRGRRMLPAENWVLWVPCSASHGCRLAGAQYRCPVNKEVKSSKNRQTYFTSPCHALDENFLKDTRFLLLSFPVLFFGSLRLKATHSRLFMSVQPRGMRSRTSGCSYSRRVFKVKDS